MVGLMDANNFFVSCERLFRPDLARKPVAVLSSNDGCIVSRSEEVKRIGVPMGAPLFEVMDMVKKHDIVLFSSNFPLYRDLSGRVMSALSGTREGVEVYSVDEAFFAVYHDEDEGSMSRLRRDIMSRTGIPVSLGVAKTKTLAKLASTYAKKGEGVFFVDDAFVEREGRHIPVGAIWGIGRSMTDTLTKDGILTIDTFLSRGLSYARATFGVVGERIFHELTGTPAALSDDESSIEASISSTRSFRDTTSRFDDVMGALAYHVAFIGEKLRARGHMAHELTILAHAGRYSSFAHRKGSARVVFSVPTDSTETLVAHARELFTSLYDADIPYKKAGAVVHGIIPREYVSPSLLTGEVREKSSHVYDIVDALNERFGAGTLHPGTVMKERAWGSRLDKKSPSYTTAWSDIPRVKAV